MTICRAKCFFNSIYMCSLKKETPVSLLTMFSKHRNHSPVMCFNSLLSLNISLEIYLKALAVVRLSAMCIFSWITVGDIMCSQGDGQCKIMVRQRAVNRLKDEEFP